MIWTQQNTQRFATVRLKWKTGFTLHKEGYALSYIGADYVIPLTWDYVKRNMILRY